MVFFDDKAATINDLIEAVEAIEQELGLTPAGVYASVRTRLDILEARINNPFAPAPNVENPFFIGNDGVTISTGFGFPTENRIPGSLYLREDGYNIQGLYARRPDGYWHQIDTDPWTANRDLAGSIYTQTVVGLQNHDINPNASLLQTDAAGDGYVLTWNATANAGNGWWEPQIGFFAASDLAGNKIAQTVIRIQNRPVAAFAPGDGYALTWNATAVNWEPQRQAVVFDALDNATTTNIRSNRYLTQSSIDNTKVGIVNLGSDSTQSTDGVSANYASILGGDQNVVSGDYSAVVSGFASDNSGIMSVITGGTGNVIALGGDTSFIGSGTNNTVGAVDSGIVSGNGNIITNEGNENFIGAGNGNTARGVQGFIGSGLTNNIQPNALQGVIAGGANNIIGNLTTSGFIGNGNTNVTNTSSVFNSILNGHNNTTDGDYSTILGGFGNLNQDGYCFINGTNNVLLVGKYSFVHGSLNHVNADHSRVWGVSNHIDGTGSTFGTILGANNTIGDLFSNTTHNTLIGHNNSVLTGTPFSTLIGDSNSVGDGYSFVFGLSNTTLAGAQFATVFGNNNSVAATAPHGTVIGSFGKSRMPGQYVQSAHSWTSVGDSQFSRIIVDGYSAGGSQILLQIPGDGYVTMENDKAYDINVRILVTNVTGTFTCARFVWDILAHQSAGTLILDSVTKTLETDNGTGWTTSIGTPTSTSLPIAVDGSGTFTRRAIATVEWREISRL